MEIAENPKKSRHKIINIMKKKLFVIAASVCSLSLLAQTSSIEVGDSVMVNRTTKTYLTGEVPSLWVYDVSHTVSQIGSKNYPNGILLNIEGANSWLSASDVTKLQDRQILSSSNNLVTTQTITIVDTVFISVPQEPIMIRDTVYQINTVVDTFMVQAPKVDITHFQLNGNIVGIGGANNAGLGLELLFGARLCDYVFAGGGLAIEQLWIGLDSKSVHGMQFPVFANIKAYIPIKEQYFPYFEMSAGVNLGKLDNGQSDLGRKASLYYGLYSRAGIGLEYKNLSIGLGYQYGNGCSPIEKDHHHAYLKIGFVFINNK